MGDFTIVISILLLIGIPFFELIRRKERIIDFLSLTNVLFLILYGLTPLYLYAFEEYTSWKIIKYRSIHETTFFTGTLLALLFYVVVIIVYYSSEKLTIVHKAKKTSIRLFEAVEDKHYHKVAMILFLIGGLSLLIYMQVLGGYSQFMQLGAVLRDDSSIINSSYMFLFTLCPLLSVASFLFYAIWRNGKGSWKIINFILFVLSTWGAVLTLYHSSGRIAMFTYLITLPLVYIVYKNRIKIGTIILGLFLFMFLVIFGDQVLDARKEGPLVYKASDKIEVVGDILQEFSFPFVNMGNGLFLYPYQYDYRGGLQDVMSASVEYIPSRILLLDSIRKQSISDFNTTIYNTAGQIPIDIVSFGQRSFGIAGILIVAVLYGFFMKLFESLFSSRKSFIACLFFVTTMMSMTFILMYGDPVQVVKSNFKYVVTFVLIYLIVRKRKTKFVWSSNHKYKHSEHTVR